MNWIDILQAVISGVFVGLVVFGLDQIRSRRERKLSDFRVAANWETMEQKVSLRNFYLPEANLSGFDLSKSNLESAYMRKAGLWATNLTDTNLRGVNLRRSELVGTNLRGTISYYMDLSHSIIRRHNYPDLDCHADLSNAILTGTKFRKATLQEVYFNNTILERADFTGAIVEECDFTNADLTGSKWKKVKKVKNCIWKGVKGATSDNFPDQLLKEIEKQNAEK